MFAPLLPRHFFRSSGDNRIVMTRRNNLMPFSCTVMVPYEWVWIVGSCLSLPTFARSMTSWMKWSVFHSSLLFSVPVDPVRCGLSPSLVWSCCFLDFIPSIPIMAMASGSKGGESHVFSVVGFSVLEPLYDYTFWAKTFPWFSW
jgi:predicted AlkP superfamily pyrophosphatase or phosphodiesterase